MKSIQIDKEIWRNLNMIKITNGYKTLGHVIAHLLKTVKEEEELK